MNEPVRGRVFEGFLLMLGLIVDGWLLDSQIKASQLTDRYVLTELAHRTGRRNLIHLQQIRA